MLKKQLTDDLVTAIKNKDKESINAIRLILAAIKDKEIALRSEDKNKEISEEIIFNILKNMVKQRNESIDLYKKGNRPELADKEKKEIDIIQKFLPKQLDENVVKEICKEIIQKLNAKNMSDMGKVIAEIKKHKSSSQIDMVNVSSYVKIILNS
tara:strand:- start:158 stop:619 length:462 start_codon:yes stop_codon:yes gene_type:complete